MTTNETDFLNYMKTGNMEMTGKYGIPVIKGLKIKDLCSVDLIGFNYATNPKTMQERENSMVHFFLPDSNIERVWNRPDDYIPIFNVYKGLIQPDFSQYVGMPKAMLIWQHYRRMWLTRYLQDRGLKVIAAPCWSDEDSFEYCFDGMPKNSCLCISSVGCMKNPVVRSRFKQGFRETLRRLTPSQLILYGLIDDDMREQIKETPYVHLDSEMHVRINTYKEKLKGDKS